MWFRGAGVGKYVGTYPVPDAGALLSNLGMLFPLPPSKPSTAIFGRSPHHLPPWVVLRFSCTGYLNLISPAPG